jgi:S-DNA-T family DNA segregation ATPase FtsK/SpoIIIE
MAKSTTKTKTAKTDPHSKARQKAKEIQEKRKADKRVVDEIWAIITIALGIFFAVSVFTGGAGTLGVMLKDVMQGLFGHMAKVFPFILIVFGVLLFAKKTSHFNLKTLLLLILLVFMACTMNSIRFVDVTTINWNLVGIVKEFYVEGVTLKSGGLFGMIIAQALLQWLGKAGAWIFSIVVTLVCLMLIINTPISKGLQKLGEKMEEHRLMKENAHLDDADNMARAVESVPHDPWPTVKKPSAEDMPRREIPVKTADQIGVASGKEDVYVPISELVNPTSKKDKKQAGILSLLNSDNLFGKSEKSDSTGLDGKSEVKHGYGLEGDAPSPEYDDVDGRTSEKETVSVPDKEHVKPISKQEASQAMLSQDEINRTKVSKKYKMPPINLLDKPVAGSKESVQSLQARAEKLEETLKSFGVDASVIQVTQGPSVTRYEVQPAFGVKVARIVSLANDIALNLRAKSIRIEAPIPGKAAIGIEIENEKSSPVYIREIIDSQNFRDAKSKISIALGKDIGGNAVVADLKSMPHLLIAGSTGSGKSVCINSILTSLLYKANPDEVKLILIDPKVVELSNYNGIPHLYVPVVTDPTKAAAALNWAVAEMEERYNKFSIEGAKDLASYNDLVTMNDEPEKVLPQVVIVIDELADLMMAAPKQVQDSIMRIAQKARAAGMHLIVATQRPSVDVITGVIKANIPSRIAFAVSSHVDSMTILDEKGAEKLIGKGDMLFSPIGQSEPTRVQGCFVSDREVNAVIDYVKKQAIETNNEKQIEILERMERSTVDPKGGKEQDSDTDELLMDSIECVIDSGKASVSLLQRRFRIGYNRAARIVDIMEDMGVVGPQDGSSPRKVLMTREEFEELKEKQEEMEIG